MMPATLAATRSFKVRPPARTLGVLLTLAALSFAPVHAAAQQASATPVADADAEAKRLFGEGKRLLDEENYAAAADMFQRAYSLSGRTSLLYNQAYALDKAGRSRDALLLARDARTQMREDEDHAHLDDLIARLEAVVTEDAVAREYFKVAQIRMKEGLYAEAAIGFGEAYKLSGLPEMLLNQARAQAKAGDLPSALELTTRALASIAPASPLRVTASLLHARLAHEVNIEAQRRGRMRVRTEPPDALVRVDGAPVARASDNVAEGVFSAGPHQLDVSRQGFVGVTQVIELKGGDTLEPSITLQYAACELAGQRRVRSAPEFCCWPDQTVSEGVCTGQPSCPIGLEPLGNVCVTPRPIVQSVAPNRGQKPKPKPLPSEPTQHSVNIDVVMLPLVASSMKKDPLGTSATLGSGVNFRVGYRVLSWVSVEAGYGYGVALGTGDSNTFDATHTTYLLGALHRAKQRQRGNRDLFVRSGLIPYFRTVTLGKEPVIYERRGWGIPLSVGVNFQRGPHFGFGLELHGEWVKFGQACEQGFGRGCVDGGSALRAAFGMSFLWSAP
jgi:tetratricopeptide (TPR) repeat protein